ncbi:MAG: hypothetical protein UT48_C0004G0009 [Parcubacteria group bacterium GW2011_GWE2_39_37]|uniref:General secretion pathway GspH domain-containing protein n=1 Tax=Candidatus Falkowbacteria bacterium GW2011_GWF2_39_8 TaxID=1618642 RepID=A0A0G0PTF5_9BACT|nr:MAG: hypothetical protein UT48_C0004G0009 [Parcubacteria group bacterium GW2011_GWE2_39_37]KKR31178.1 MAG: hypothetical protein UT64_C0070G0006 [Candidatus Falkowbacteria bacterium GW2011_GWF2_39_8]
MNKYQRGALLMNVMVSISIMVMLTALSIPYFREYQTNLKLSTAIKTLGSDLRYAQQLTVSEQIPHQVAIDRLNGSYDLLKIDLATTTIKSVELDPDISFQQINSLTNDRVIFNSYGGVSEAGQIILQNPAGQTNLINIKPSGYIELSQ